MSIGQHTLDKYREFLREFAKRPSVEERKARTAERHRLKRPTQITVAFVVVGLSMLLIWSLFPTLFGR